MLASGPDAARPPRTEPHSLRGITRLTSCPAFSKPPLGYCTFFQTEVRSKGVRHTTVSIGPCSVTAGESHILLLFTGKQNTALKQFPDRLKPLTHFAFFSFLELHLQHMEVLVPRRGVESELQLPVYTTATAAQDLNHVCDIHHTGSLIH